MEVQDLCSKRPHNWRASKAHSVCVVKTLTDCKLKGLPGGELGRVKGSGVRLKQLSCFLESGLRAPTLHDVIREAKPLEVGIHPGVEGG